MQSFNEWKLMREERDIAQSAYNALNYLQTNPDMYARILDGAIQDAQQMGNQQVVGLLHNMKQIAGSLANAKYDGRGSDPNLANNFFEKARMLWKQISSTLSPEAAAFHAGRQGNGMMGQEPSSINTAAYKRGMGA